MKIKITNSYIPAGYQNGDIFEVKYKRPYGYIVQLENGLERFIANNECIELGEQE